MDAREERLARNESLFRDLNEQIEFVAKPLDPDAHLFAFFCECSNIDCTLSMPMPLTVYEEVRADPTTFVVAPGHDLPEIEEVVRRTAEYQIVRKHGDAARLVTEDDPRS
jgi:hypothetical protein